MTNMIRYCPDCGGSGERFDKEAGDWVTPTEPCPTCNGTGESSPPCPECGGSGLVEMSMVPGGTLQFITTFCQCDTGEQMRVDYETDQQEWEDVRREGREVGG